MLLFFISPTEPDGTEFCVGEYVNLNANSSTISTPIAFFQLPSSLCQHGVQICPDMSASSDVALAATLSSGNNFSHFAFIWDSLHSSLSRFRSLSYLFICSFLFYQPTPWLHRLQSATAMIHPHHPSTSSSSGSSSSADIPKRGNGAHTKHISGFYHYFDNSLPKSGDFQDWWVRLATGFDQMDSGSDSNKKRARSTHFHRMFASETGQSNWHGVQALFTIFCASSSSTFRFKFLSRLILRQEFCVIHFFLVGAHRPRLVRCWRIFWSLPLQHLDHRVSTRRAKWLNSMLLGTHIPSSFPIWKIQSLMTFQESPSTLARTLTILKSSHYWKRL